MSLVQATSTQTDYVMTFWLTGFVYLLWMTYQQPSWALAIAAGAFLGFALLTKGTAYLFAPVWIVIFLIATLRTRDRHRLKLLVFIIALACIINIPFRLTKYNFFWKSLLDR